MRWESQNHITDHNDWAPRVGLAYALDGGKGKQAKTVLRAGFGDFYDRFSCHQPAHRAPPQSAEQDLAEQSDLHPRPRLRSNAIDLSTCQSGAGDCQPSAVPVRYQRRSHLPLALHRARSAQASSGRSTRAPARPSPTCTPSARTSWSPSTPTSSTADWRLIRSIPPAAISTSSTRKRCSSRTSSSPA